MKTVLVTGDSRGLGVAIVEKILTETNYNVVGVSRTLTPKCSELISKFKDRFFHYNFDLAESEELGPFFKNELKKHSPYVGYVNNAAIAYDDIITNLQLDPLIKMFHVNVFSAMHLTKLVLRDMILRKTEGSIVHISSISAHTGYKGLSMYASTKGALESFSKNTAREWGSMQIRSNCVCPGFMSTDMSASLSFEQKDRIYNRTSLKKETSVDSVASTILFLLQSGSSSITGQVLNVDNGTI